MTERQAPPAGERRCSGGDVEARGTISLPVVDAEPAPAGTIRRSRSGRRRAIVLITIQLLMIAHVVQWLITGRTTTPVEPSESMEFVKNGVINAGLIFFALALLATLVLGRWFCGWGCHVVMLQDFCGWLMKKAGIRPKPFRSRLLIYVPLLLALYMFIWPAAYRLGVRVAERMEWIEQPRLPAWTPTTELVTSEFWRTFAGVAVAIPFLFVCGFATVYFLGAKGFCTYGCPYGGFFAPLDRLAPGRIRVNDDCEQCGHCTAVCTSNVRVHEEVREFGMVVDPGCMKCLDCVSVCPNDALSFGFGRPAVARGAARNAEPARRYDLTWPEEIALAAVFGGSFFAVRSVYGIVPMLMAVGVAGCVTFLAWKLWRLRRDANVRFHRWQLRRGGSITRGGAVFAGAAVLALVLTAHCGAVRALQAAAGRADGTVTVSRAQAFTPTPAPLPDDMAAGADRAERLYALAGPLWTGGIGFLPHPETDVRMAWLAACRGDHAAAERFMRRRTARFGAVDAIARDTALLMELQGKWAEAVDELRATVAAHPDFVLSFDLLAARLDELGRGGEARTILDDAISRVREGSPAHPALLRRRASMFFARGETAAGIADLERALEHDRPTPITLRQLAGAELQRGDRDRAVEIMRDATERFPKDAALLNDYAMLLEMVGRSEEAASARARAARLEE